MSLWIRVEAVLGDIKVQRREGDVQKVDERAHNCSIKLFNGKPRGEVAGMQHLVGNYMIYILAMRCLPTGIARASRIVLPAIHGRSAHLSHFEQQKPNIPDLSQPSMLVRASSMTSPYLYFPIETWQCYESFSKTLQLAIQL
jgi:hypothetical protein